MQLRVYKKSDNEGIKYLQGQFLKEFFNKNHLGIPNHQQISQLENEIYQIIREGGNMWIIENEGEVIGTTAIKVINEITVELIMMRVKKEHRGQGLGKKLLVHALDYCKKTGKKRVILHTAEKLTIAKKMYESHGFLLYSKRNLGLPYNFVVLSYEKTLE